VRRLGEVAVVLLLVVAKPRLEMKHNRNAASIDRRREHEYCCFIVELRAKKRIVRAPEQRVIRTEQPDYSIVRCKTGVRQAFSLA